MCITARSGNEGFFMVFLFQPLDGA
jgi:hypothetical protein